MKRQVNVSFSHKSLLWILPGLVVLCILFVFSGVEKYSSLIIDDRMYLHALLENMSGGWLSALNWIFTESPKEIGFYVPLPLVVMAIFVDLFGNISSPVHFLNIVIHSLNSVLLFNLLVRMRLSSMLSFAAVLLFAIHPYRVESVVWIVELKDMMLGFFVLLSCHFYLLTINRKSKIYIVATFVSMILALFSKPTAVVLPILFVCLDWWPLQRLSKDNIIKRLLQKWQYILLSGAWSLLTLYFASKYEATANADVVNIFERIGNACISYVTYIYQSIVPLNLSIFYIHELSVNWYEAIACAAFLFVITVFSWKTRKLFPFLIFGWIWFVVSLLPNSGLIQSGLQARADRFTYLAHMGFFISGVWFVAYFIKKYSLHLIGFLLVVVVSAGFMLTSHARVAMWENELILFGQALQENPDNYVIRTFLAIYLMENEKYDNAIHHIEKVSEQMPRYLVALQVKGQLYRYVGMQQKAARIFTKALELFPHDFKVRFALADTYRSLNDIPKALEVLSTFKGDPEKEAEVHHFMGTLLLAQEQYAEAIDQFSQSVEKYPGASGSWAGLGIASQALEENKKALEYFTKAHNINSYDPGPPAYMGKFLVDAGKFCESIPYLLEALCLDYSYKPAWNALRTSSRLCPESMQFGDVSCVSNQ